MGPGLIILAICPWSLIFSYSLSCLFATRGLPPCPPAPPVSCVTLSRLPYYTESQSSFAEEVLCPTTSWGVRRIKLNQSLWKCFLNLQNEAKVRRDWRRQWGSLLHVWLGNHTKGEQWGAQVRVSDLIDSGHACVQDVQQIPKIKNLNAPWWKIKSQKQWEVFKTNLEKKLPLKEQ